MTHNDLVERAARWLRNTKRCGVVATPRAATGILEIPDAIGWAIGGRRSLLVECKVSRNDFLAERRKIVRDARYEAALGHLGHLRWYMVPVGLIAPSEVHSGWGLLESDGTRVRESLPAPECPPHMIERVTLRGMPILYSLARVAQQGTQSSGGAA